MAGDGLLLDITNTANDLEMKRDAEKRKLHRMAKNHNLLEMWQGSQNLHAIQKESGVQNMQLSAIEYISDNEEIGKASWSNIQPDGVAAFKLSDRLPGPPALSA